MRYTSAAVALQEPIDTKDLRRIADRGTEVPSVAEECAFQRRLDTRLTFSQLRAQICLDYELGCVDAQSTINRLYAAGFIASPDDLAFLICAGVKSLQEGTV
jgi:hypothetical protein